MTGEVNENKLACWDEAMSSEACRNLAGLHGQPKSTQWRREDFGSGGGIWPPKGYHAPHAGGPGGGRRPPGR